MTACRSDPLIPITSRWLTACQRRQRDVHPVAYLYWMTCGFWPTDEQRAVILEWSRKLDGTNSDAVLVLEYLRVMGLTSSALGDNLLPDIF